MSGPDFNELVGDDLPAEEAARLHRIHDMLVEAGPPPELPPALAEPPGRGRRDDNVRYLPRRRLGAVVLIAAAIIVVALSGGYALGHRSSNAFPSEFSIPMHGTNGSSATASIEVASKAPSGNWPLKMVVRGLPDLGRKGYYELLLTRGSRVETSCGTFAVGEGRTEVRLNAPYLLTRDAHPGWIVVEHLRGETGQGHILMTT